MKDLIIIGGGPAGITAAVYAARKRLDFSVITKDIGGQAAWSADIENYTGYQFITGPDLVGKFREHLDQYTFDLQEGVEVKKIEKANGGFKVVTSSGDLSAKTIIVVSGKKPRTLNIPGEEKYKNKGVAYCATCDGPLFGGKEVAVVGGGNSALDAALQMMKIAKKVYLITVNDQLLGDVIMIEKVKKAENIEILYKTQTKEVFGEKFVGGIKIEQEGKLRKIDLNAVFIEVGLIPNSQIIDFVEKNKNGEIIVTCGATTSEPGIFAAGDVTDVPDKQIVIAAGDGAKAALGAFKYIATH